MRTPRTSPARAAAAAALAALCCLTACSAGGEGATTSGGSVSAQEPMKADDLGGAGAAGGRSGTGADTPEKALGDGAQRVAPRTTSVIRTGEMALTSKDIAAVRVRIDDLVAALGGTVDQDETTTDRKGRVDRSVLVLRVPVARFDAAQDALRRLGTLKSSTESGKDVTTEVIDVAERVQTLRNSLDRLQRFQRTSKDVADLIRYESEITRRQSELQSLEAQQAYLVDRTSMSTITVRLSTPETYVEPPGALDDAGFLPGVQAGWKALVGFLVVAATVAGALLPFAVAAVLVGVPAWLGLRLLLRRRRATSAATAAPPAATGP